MKNAIKSQLYILLNRKQYKFILAVSIALSLLSFAFYAFADFGQYMPDIKSFRDTSIISSKNMFSSILFTVLPILSVVPFCDSYIDDKKNNRLPVIFQLCSREQYFYSKLFVCAYSTVLTVGVPVFINLILGAAAFPDISTADLTGLASNQAFLYLADSEYMTTLAFKNLFISYPFLYSLIYVIFITLYAGVGAMLTYSLSFYFKNRAMIVVPFFVFNTLLNIISSFTLSNFGFEISMSDYVLSENISRGINYLAFFAIIILMLALSIVLSRINIKKLGDVV
ncbi:MAG: hypothetical protein PUE08_07160 [Eubacteriales bacterium]|nr:hypothetical protein [Eubacteriales bacterium]